MSKNKNKNKNEKVRRQQQRDTVKNLHRKLNDLEVQLYHLQGKNEAHLEEKERAVATATEQFNKKLTAVQKEAALVPELRQQLTTKDQQLRTATTELAGAKKEASQVLELKKQLTSKENQLKEASSELAVAKARDVAHDEELQRVRRETEEQVTATITKQLDEEKKKRERVEEGNKKLQECIDLAQKLTSVSEDESSPQKRRGRKEEGNATLTLRIPEEIVIGVDLLDKSKILPKKEVAKAVADFLRPIIMPKAEEASKVLRPIIAPSDDDVRKYEEPELFNFKSNTNCFENN